MGAEFLIVAVSFLIASYITADRVPATRSAVRTATKNGGRAAARTARQTWSQRRAGRRKAFAAWWAKTKPRRLLIKIVKVAGRGVTSTGALGRDAVVTIVLAGVAGATEAAEGWRTGREKYRKQKADSDQPSPSDSEGEKPADTADSTIPQPRTGDEPAADLPVGQPTGTATPPSGQEPGATSDGTEPSAGRSALMTAQAGEQVDLSGVINWCDGAFASADGSETVGYVNSGTQLYESFGGAIAGIGGQVAEAATAEQEAATAARDALAAWGEAVLHLKDRCRAAIGG